MTVPNRADHPNRRPQRTYSSGVHPAYDAHPDFSPDTHYGFDKASKHLDYWWNTGGSTKENRDRYVHKIIHEDEKGNVHVRYTHHAVPVTPASLKYSKSQDRRTGIHDVAGRDFYPDKHIIQHSLVDREMAIKENDGSPIGSKFLGNTQNGTYDGPSHLDK